METTTCIISSACFLSPVLGNDDFVATLAGKRWICS